MNDDCDDSFGEDGDDEMMDGGSELTTQLAAAGWQHGVVFCFVLFLHFIIREVPRFMFYYRPAPLRSTHLNSFLRHATFVLCSLS